MDDQNFLEMMWLDHENLLHDLTLLQNIEAFNLQQELLSLDFGHPASSGINQNVDAAHPMDNISKMSIHASPDSLPDPNLVYEGGISVRQASEFGNPNQKFVPTKSLSTPNYGIPVTSFSSLITQGISSSSFPSQSVNPLNISSQDKSRTSFSSFPTYELNPLNSSGQGPSVTDSLGFSTPEPCVNKLGFTNPNLPVMDTLNSLVQDLTSLDFSNQGMYVDTVDFPNQKMFTLDAWKEMASLGIPNQSTYMNTLNQIQPVSMPKENIGVVDEMNMVSSSANDQSQKNYDSNDGNGKGKGKAKVGRESKIPLSQTITKEMIAQHFHLPMSDAAKKLGIGTSLLKHRCRDFNIKSWPQRKFKSLRSIIARLEIELGESPRIEVKEKVQEALVHLENEKKRIAESPDLELEDSTIRLRKICYAADLKRLKTL